jgi:hypothetical protein
MDFKLVMETVTGLNLQVFFDQWFYGEGFPTFNVKYNQIGNNLFIKSTETVSLSTVTPFFKTHLDYLIHTTLGDTVVRLEQNQNIENYTLEINGNVTGIELDSKNWVINKVNSISIDSTLSIVERDSFENYILYPNPANETLNFQKAINAFVKIYASNGSLVLSEAVVNTINIKDLSNGLYFLEYTTSAGETKRNKFIKN